MLPEEEFDEFDTIMRKTWAISAIFIISINSALVYVVWSRKSLHHSFFVFMVCFAVCDIYNGFWLIFTWTSTFVSSPIMYPLCKLTYYMGSTERLFKAFMISIVFVVMSIKPNISTRRSLNVIAILSIACAIFAIPEGLDVELIPYIDDKLYCLSLLSYHPIVKFLFLVLKCFIPASILIGYFVMTSTRNQWREKLTCSKMQKIMLIFLAIYLICWMPFLILQNFENYFTRDNFSVLHFYRYWYILFHLYTFATLSMVYKPFLLYFMSDEFNLAVNQILRPENNGFVSFENRICDDDNVAPLSDDF